MRWRKLRMFLFSYELEAESRLKLGHTRYFQPELIFDPKLALPA